jgi:hypothetical protein
MSKGSRAACRRLGRGAERNHHWPAHELPRGRPEAARRWVPLPPAWSQGRGRRCEAVVALLCLPHRHVRVYRGVFPIPPCAVVTAAPAARAPLLRSLLPVPPLQHSTHTTAESSVSCVAPAPHSCSLSSARLAPGVEEREEQNLQLAAACPRRRNF